MAVEARRMDNLFPPQKITSRDLITRQPILNNAATCTAQIDCAAVPTTTPPADKFFLYGKTLLSNPISSLNKSESVLTHNISASTRKRPRDSPAAGGEAEAFLSAEARKRRPTGGFGPLIDGDVISQIQHQQSEMDRFIAQHMERLKFEVEERRRRQARMVTSSIQSAIAKKLKEKDEEIQRAGKLNWVLQERVKSLFVENQIWRDLAQTNEAAANNLRTNLEQALAQTAGGHRRIFATEDAESSCGSCDGAAAAAGIEINGFGSRDGGGQRRKAAPERGGCRRCGEREASVLLLPCRHLCLCTVCGSSSLLLACCPVCDTMMNASVHVNMS